MQHTMCWIPCDFHSCSYLIFLRFIRSRSPLTLHILLEISLSIYILHNHIKNVIVPSQAELPTCTTLGSTIGRHSETSATTRHRALWTPLRPPQGPPSSEKGQSHRWIFFLAGAPISWCSQRQKSTALSTTRLRLSGSQALKGHEKQCGCRGSSPCRRTPSTTRLPKAPTTQMCMSADFRRTP